MRDIELFDIYVGRAQNEANISAGGGRDMAQRKPFALAPA